jgi:hypothetical protein
VIRGEKLGSDEAGDEEMERQPRRLDGLCESFMGKGKKQMERERTSETAPTVIGRTRSDPSHAFKDKRRSNNETLAHPMRSKTEQNTDSET